MCDEMPAELRSAAGCEEERTIDAPIKNIVNTLLYVVGILAVVMIIFAGVKMTTSAGNPGAVEKAKLTLIYAIVGLAISLLAYAIVNFVVGRL